MWANICPSSQICVCDHPKRATTQSVLQSDLIPIEKEVWVSPKDPTVSPEVCNPELKKKRPYGGNFTIALNVQLGSVLLSLISLSGALVSYAQVVTPTPWLLHRPQTSLGLSSS